MQVLLCECASVYACVCVCTCVCGCVLWVCLTNSAYGCEGTSAHCNDVCVLCVCACLPELAYLHTHESLYYLAYCPVC